MGLLFLGFICLAKSRTGAVARGGWDGPPPTPFRGRGAVPGTATPISETTTTRYQYFNTSIFANFCITNQSVIIFLAILQALLSTFFGLYERESLFLPRWGGIIYEQNDSKCIYENTQVTKLFGIKYFNFLNDHFRLLAVSFECLFMPI